MSSFSIIFDLDGTLVDSSAGILMSLEAALRDEGITPLVPLSHSLIGPPLRDMLFSVCPNPTIQIIDRLSASFRHNYDSYGCIAANPFPGVCEMLQALSAAKISLYIATNKRAFPTLKILNSLGWSGFFGQVISPDSYEPPLPSKAAILAKIIKEVSLDPLNCCYVGDRLDDYYAAFEIGIPFAFADWGYEGLESDFPPNTIRILTPDAEDVMSCLADGD